MKKEIIPDFLWHLDEVVLAFQTTIVTTVDKDGRVNAAPFGLVYPFSTGSNPQLLVGINSRWHTARNIETTGEFVVNYASFSMLEQVAQTGLLYDEGVNELEKAGLTALPDLYADMARRIPMQRWGRPGEVAAVMWMLAQPELSFVTGVTVPVDGGISANAGHFLPARANP